MNIELMQALQLKEDEVISIMHNTQTNIVYIAMTEKRMLVISGVSKDIPDTKVHFTMGKSPLIECKLSDDELKTTIQRVKGLFQDTINKL